MVGIEFYPPQVPSDKHSALPEPPHSISLALLRSLAQIIEIVRMYQPLHNSRICHDLAGPDSQYSFTGRADKCECPPAIRKDSIFINNRRQMCDQVLHEFAGWSWLDLEFRTMQRKSFKPHH